MKNKFDKTLDLVLIMVALLTVVEAFRSVQPLSSVSRSPAVERVNLN